MVSALLLSSFLPRNENSPHEERTDRRSSSNCEACLVCQTPRQRSLPPSQHPEKGLISRGQLDAPSPTTLDTTLYWNHVRARAAPLFALWQADPNPRYGASRTAKELGTSVTMLQADLRMSGLPPYDLLHEWYLLIHLVDLSQRSSLSRLAWKWGREPATYYRFAKRVSGTSWVLLNREGPDALRERAVHVWAAVTDPNMRNRISESKQGQPVFR